MSCLAAFMDLANVITEAPPVRVPPTSRDDPTPSVPEHFHLTPSATHHPAPDVSTTVHNPLSSLPPHPCPL
jgi:hypothetical protein